MPELVPDVDQYVFQRVKHVPFPISYFLKTDSKSCDIQKALYRRSDLAMEATDDRGKSNQNYANVPNSRL